MLSSQSLALCCLVSLLLTSPVAHPQTAGKVPENAARTESSPAAPHYSFEVASIRPSPPDANFSFMRTADGFRGTGLTLTTVILLAHLPSSLWSKDRIQNAPAWASKDRYDINAKVAPQDLDAWTHQSLAEPTVMRAMLLSMLEDRCHLQMHTVPAEMPGFALAVSRHGAPLRASTPGEPIPDGMKLTDGGVAHGERLDDGTTTWHFHNASIAGLINFLTFLAHTRILDQTGLTSHYDFALAALPDRPLDGGGSITDPATFWDLRALGLRTVPAKVPTINIVVDHIEPPSEN